MNEPTQRARVVRFGVFEVDLRTAELRKQGVRIRLPGQSFQVLEALVRRPGELVTRADLKQKLWPEDSYGDFEHGINAAVNRVREALGDSSDNPRFVETLPRRGYRFIAQVHIEPDGTAKEASTPNGQPGPAAELHLDIDQNSHHEPVADPQPSVAFRPRNSIRRSVAVAAVAVTVLVLLVMWWRTPPAVPVVESVIQLTDDGQPKDSMVSDRSRVYFNEGPKTSRKIAQVSITGGPTAPVETRFVTSFIDSITHNGSALLVIVPDGAPDISSSWFLWSVPLPTGEPRRLLGSFETETADIVPDGRILFAQYLAAGTTKGTGDRTDWLIADKDGSNSRKLVSFPGLIGDVDVSPDGQRILVTQEQVGDRKLFEVASDGTGLRELRKLVGDEHNFRWCANEKCIVYQSGSNLKSDIWLLPMKNIVFRHTGNPIRLTNGPMPYSNPYPNPDGKQIFALGTKQRGELVRYDLKSHEFLPFLSGISATDPTFSRDGRWVAYTSPSDHTLWRSLSDGSERVQLTFPPTEVEFPAISPDGTKISFHSYKRELFVVGVEGRTPQKVSDSGWYASWSPNGNYLFYQDGRPPYLPHIIDIRTNRESTMTPTKDPFGGGFWLSQDILVGLNEKHTKFVTFNLKTQQFKDLWPSPLNDIENWMLSPDAKYLYFTTRGAEPKVMRISVADHKLETITSLKDLYRAANSGETQINVAPDGSPIFTLDTGYQEIYALNIRWP